MLPMSNLPHLVRVFCMNHEAWIVGGAAHSIVFPAENRPIRDYDLLIPSWQWGSACVMIPKGTPANSFGGFKIALLGKDGVKSLDVDVWQGDIGWFLANAPRQQLKGPRMALQPVTETVLFAKYSLEECLPYAIENNPSKRRKYGITRD